MESDRTNYISHFTDPKNTRTVFSSSSFFPLFSSWIAAAILSTKDTMDSRSTTIALEGSNQSDHITVIQPPNYAVGDQKPNMVLSEEDGVNQMTLNIAAQPTAGAPKAALVTQQPAGVPGMKPENYVIRLENLGEQPDYVDCPYCKTRQKTTIQHESTSQTSYAILSMWHCAVVVLVSQKLMVASLRLTAAVCCLCCGIIPVFIPFCCHWCSDTDHYCAACRNRVAHMPHEGRMQPVLPQATPRQPGANPKYQISQFANMSHQTQQKLEPGNTRAAV